MNFHFILCSFFLFLLCGCAGQRLPEGGPVDSDPPEIVSVYPQPGAVNFSESSIIIEFSEYVDRRSTEEAIFISPSIEEKEFDWSGTELEISFNEELRKNTTYVITVGTDVTDIRANNRLAKAFTLSFSTGPTIDKGMIAGKVFDEKPDGVMIFSYRLDDLLPDTLNPAITKPDYLSQAGKTGEFVLKNVAPGTYRLFAIRDEYRNLLYEPETDAAGTTDDIIITDTDTLRSGVQFIIAKEDTTAPRLSQVQATDKCHLNVQFSEEMDSASIRTTGFIITDTLFKSTLPVMGFFSQYIGNKNITLLTEQQRPDERYVLRVKGVVDRSHYPINPMANAKQFNGSSVKDTIAPVLSSSTIHNPSAKIFSNDKLIFTFSDAIRWPIADSSIIVRRSKDSSIVPVTITLETAATIAVRPNVQWNFGEQYSVMLKWKGFADLFGNSGMDTTMTLKFATGDPENYGSIEGIFTGFTASSTVIQAENIVEKSQQPGKTRTGTTGEFSFTRLPEGRYVLKVFDDVNNNFVHDAGSPFPYRKAERFTGYSDTIRVRARWPVDGINFKAP